MASYPQKLEEQFKKIGCGEESAPYVARGLMRQLTGRFVGHLTQEAEVAKAFLDEATCPGARGLSEEDKAQLRRISGRAQQAGASDLMPQK